MLTIITPVNCTNKSSYLFERTISFIDTCEPTPEISRIIVDFGSAPNLSDQFQRRSESKGIRYIRLNRFGQPFSIGICRNSGVQASTTEFITFQDIDLFAPPSFYKSILNRLKNSKYFNDIEVIPCLYLSEDYSKEYISGDPEESHKSAYSEYLDSGKSISLYAPTSSSILVRRNYFLEIGGNRESYHGHGYEDFECLNRLACLSMKYTRSSDYYNHLYKYDSPLYRGYRTFFSMFGRALMNERIFFVHLWHPTGEDRSYSEKNSANRRLFERHIRDFDKTGSLPPALSGASTSLTGTTLVLVHREGKTANSVRQLIPHLGATDFVDEDTFKTTDEFSKYLTKNKITRVFFFNSFGNHFRLKLYRKCKQLGLQTLNFDRGALPDSWFIDPNGFNADSTSYDENHWERELTPEEREEVSEYITSVLNMDDALEKNPLRIGFDNFVRKHHLRRKKVLFIPMQRPDDSVIRYLAGEDNSIDNFTSEIKKLASSISDSGWHILVKQHPLEPALPDFGTTNITTLNSETHFYDAISASDAVLTINSGVGIYSLMLGKPTFNVGRAFYSHPGLSVNLDNVISFNREKDNLIQPDRNRVEKFIHYLWFRFYTHGKAQYRETRNTHTGSTTSSAAEIEFSKILIPGALEYTFLPRRKVSLSKNTRHFDYFRSSILLEKHSEPRKIDPSQEVRKKPDTKSMQAPHPGPGKFSRKFRKFRKSPTLFFKDFLLKRLQTR
ncbi:glycosyltransferase [Pandoraea sp. NPDC087047]|uniref:capsular polysaccharide export protein, LipB/KpsS family n=1 Tax=Pandoraea sp. NPDC087047 TaxID=3364390 RepID=UPI0037FE5113